MGAKKVEHTEQELIAVGKDGVLKRFEDTSPDGEKAMQVEDMIANEYGVDYDCVILPANAPANHPLVQLVEKTMDVDLQGALS